MAGSWVKEQENDATAQLDVSNATGSARATENRGTTTTAATATAAPAARTGCVRRTGCVGRTLSSVDSNAIVARSTIVVSFMLSPHVLVWTVPSLRFVLFTTASSTRPWCLTACVWVIAVSQ
jgi:hypothetical protein